MEHYKATCNNCKRTRTWVDYKTLLFKSAKQIAAFKARQNICKYCGHDSLTHSIPEESRLFYESAAKTLSGKN